MKNKSVLLIVFLMSILMICTPIAGAQETIKMSTTTSTQNSGLLDILLPEFTKDTGIEVKGRFGSVYHDGQVERSGFNTVLPPNGPSCAQDRNVNADSNHLVYPPSSHHPGGVNCLKADGSVTFYSDSIDTGNLTARQPNDGPSIYGVWGALGSKAGGDTTGGL